MAIQISGTTVIDNSRNINAGITTVSAGTAGVPSITPTGDTNTGIFFPAADTVAISEGGTEALRVDSSGRLLVGTSSARLNFFSGSTTDPVKTQIEGAGTAGDAYVLLSLVANNDNANARVGANLVIARSYSNTIGSNTLVLDGTNLGNISFQGADGTGFEESARIAAFVDGTPGNNDMPGRLVFSTTADGSASPTEAMRINNQQELLVGTATRNANGGVLQLKSGITFPATAVAATDANTLDDYEEGTWTPSIGGNATYTVQTGAYTKVGRLVHVSVMLTVNTIGTGSVSSIFDLPFVIGGTNNDIGATVGYVLNAANSYVSIGTDAYTNQVNVRARTAASTGNAGSAFFGSGTAIRLIVVYHTN